MTRPRNMESEQSLLAKRILRTKDKAKLTAIRQVLDGERGAVFSHEELVAMEELRDRLVSGAVRGRAWEDVKKDLRKLAR
ncbi:MAG: hypothetical protein IPJ76_08170 [Flavobacteriales bacterium]|nr:MAG: hypothetical protein IPJ76_08170 [Flavobacteriales bacterium]